jgi:hypothetical protein
LKIFFPKWGQTFNNLIDINTHFIE